MKNMDSQHKTEDGKQTAADDKSPSNFNWKKLIIGSVVAVIAVVGVATPIVVIVAVSRSYLGEKQTEIGLPVIVAYLAFVAVVVQTVVNFLQWRAMRKGVQHTEELIANAKDQAETARQALHHAKNTLKLIERPNVIVAGTDIQNRMYANKWEAKVTILNTGRTAAERIRMKFGVVIEPVWDKLSGETFTDQYPGHTSEKWCERVFLAPSSNDILIYAESDIVTLDRTPDDSWRDPVIVYGHGTYEGLGGESYEIPIFAFRIENDGNAPKGFKFTRDDRLAYTWADQEKHKEKPN